MDNSQWELVKGDGPHDNSPKIIINADDYGYSWERCQGILELIRLQCISSVTVLINAPQIQDKCKQLIALIQSKHKNSQISQQTANDIPCFQTQNWLKSDTRGLSVGLHLNFTQFNPCSHSPHSSQSHPLFKGKSHLYDNLSHFTNHYDFKHFISNQIKAQIQKFISVFNFKPSHIDGHNHVHIIPQIAECVCEVGRLYGIYKVRLPIQHSSPKSEKQEQNKLNIVFGKLAMQSQKIYDKFGFIYPDFMMGLDTMGKHLTQANIKQRLQYIKQKQNQVQSQIVYKFVQIMCHPGYKQTIEFAQHPTCSFSKSQQRECQLNALKSNQFKQVSKRLYSFKDLKKNKHELSILIYSKLLCGSGNLTTSLRVGKIVEQLGFRVYYLDVPDDGKTQAETIRMRSMIQDLGICVVIGMNLTRTAHVIYRAVAQYPKQEIAYKIPYLLVIAGTDANITLQQNAQSPKLLAINQSIRNCECLISLSERMKQSAQAYLQKNNINKEIILVKQSTRNLNTQNNNPQKQQNPNITSINTDNISQNQGKPYIVFPTSFRKVKAVHHILHQLNMVIQKYNIGVYVVGPIINKQYYQATQSQLKGVKYLGCLASQQYLELLKGSYLLINCSQSEGMSCSILQAFAYHVPVIARRNQGNCQLITHNQNGFIYQNGSDFVSIFQHLRSNYATVKSSICLSAYQKLAQQFSYSKQLSIYQKVFAQHFHNFTYQIPLLDNLLPLKSSIPPCLTLFTFINVHGISPINLKIFEKFYIQNYQHNLCSTHFLELIIKKSSYIDILDIGCGNGIFTIYFIINYMKYVKINCTLKFNLYLTDIDKKCLQNTKINVRYLQQICASQLNLNCVIHSVTFLQSNMFEQITSKLNTKFDVILANMPQTPFNNNQSRVDKNGGKDGMRLMNILIQNYSKYLKNQNSFLMILYSYMNNPSKFQRLLIQNGSQIKWKSSVQTHTISRQEYEKMQSGLANLIQQIIKASECEVSLKQNIFHIPADLRIIKSIDKKVD